ITWETGFASRIVPTPRRRSSSIAAIPPARNVARRHGRISSWAVRNGASTKRTSPVARRGLQAGRPGPGALDPLPDTRPRPEPQPGGGRRHVEGGAAQVAEPRRLEVGLGVHARDLGADAVELEHGGLDAAADVEDPALVGSSREERLDDVADEHEVADL